MRRSIAIALAVLLCAFESPAVRAQVATSRAESILFFPRVVADGVRDTRIQITNTSNSQVFARCSYISGSTCTSTDFDIGLSKQQPTQWVVSRGRPADPTDARCDREGLTDCPGAGIDPGAGSAGLASAPVPAAPTGFAGQL